jgi:hypothetical protein
MSAQHIPVTTREQIASNVRVALARTQTDQKTVALALGKSETAVSERVRGVTHFRVDELQIIAGLTGVPFADLVEPAVVRA